MSDSANRTAITFSTADIDAAVKRLTSAGKQISRAVEKLLVMAVYDSIVNKSDETANALIGALRASTKKDGIIAFLEKHGQLYNKGGKTGFVHFALGSQARLTWTPDYVEMVQDAAEAWETFKPAAEVKPFDVVKAVESVIKSAGKDGIEVVDAELVPRLKALLAQYNAAKVLAQAAATAAEATAQHKDAARTIEMVEA
jgi:regulator of protease activity HflC (stomatin/prohibitin superfamily)